MHVTFTHTCTHTYVNVVEKIRVDELKSHNASGLNHKHVHSHMHAHTHLNVVEKIRVDELKSHNASGQNKHISISNKVPDALADDHVGVVDLYVCICVCMYVCVCVCVCVCIYIYIYVYICI
jgi:hypothetical protein